jgi:glutamyl-tRNA reductase
VAVVDFARRIFERFDDKRVLVIGAGEMAEETLRHLQQEGARQVTVVNRSAARAEELAARWQGHAAAWERLLHLLAEADLVVSTTGAAEPIVTRSSFRTIEAARAQRPLFILDLAMPRDFEPSVRDCLGVYLYSLDDLRQACERNREERHRERPAAERIIHEETARFMAELYHQATGPTIKRLKQSCQTLREEELRRLFNKLSHLDDRARGEIATAFDRLINKLLHPPLESLRHESQHGVPHALLDALRRLFQLKD